MRTASRRSGRARGSVDLDYALAVPVLLAGLVALGYQYSHPPVAAAADGFESASPGPVPVVWSATGPTCTYCGCDVPCDRDSCCHCGCKLAWEGARHAVAQRNQEWLRHGGRQQELFPTQSP